MSAAPADALFEPRIDARRRRSRLFAGACVAVAAFTMTVLAVLLIDIAHDGWPYLTRSFLTRYPSVLDPKSGGMLSGIAGSIWIVGLTALLAVPIGVGAAVWLEEYAPQNRLTRFIRLNIANLAGVPSIVYGILGLAIFVRWLHLGRSVAAGALTMTLLVLPVVIIASREALAAVPNSIRQAAYALGATRWQTVRSHVLPAALPGIMTGVILSLSRAIGETAPLIMLGALTYVAFVPGGALSDYPSGAGGLLEWTQTALTDQFTAMPIQVFNWTSQPQKDFHDLAAAGIMALLGALLTMNAVAIGIRAWSQRTRT